MRTARARRLPGAARILTGAALLPLILAATSSPAHGQSPDTCRKYYGGITGVDVFVAPFKPELSGYVSEDDTKLLIGQRLRKAGLKTGEEYSDTIASSVTFLSSDEFYTFTARVELWRVAVLPNGKPALVTVDEASSLYIRSSSRDRGDAVKEAIMEQLERIVTRWKETRQ